MTSKSDFIRGYYCAVAALLKEEGRNTSSESLFRQGGSEKEMVENADEIDLETFRHYGLLPRDKKPIDEPKSSVRVFDIWAEGFKTMDGEGKAQYITSIMAPGFREACVLANAAGKFAGCGNFDQESLSVWGCRLFPTEAEARAQFG